MSDRVFDLGTAAIPLIALPHITYNARLMAAARLG
jgi:hypothetical protein